MAPNANRKRGIDFIDLTDSDNAPFDPHPRKIPRSRFTDPVAPSQIDPWDRNEEDDADDVIIISQEDTNSATESFELYGVLRTKIVGVQYYDGVATDGEFVILRREPSNPFDGNAIRVDNVGRNQIGHIPRAVAAKLSDYMVMNWPNVNGIGC